MLKVIKDSETFQKSDEGNVSDNFCGFPKSTFPPYAITGQVCRVKEEVKVLTSLVQLSTRLWTPSKSNCLKMCVLILVDKQNHILPHFLWRSLLTLVVQTTCCTSYFFSSMTRPLHVAGTQPRPMTQLGDNYSTKPDPTPTLTWIIKSQDMFETN